MKPNPLVVATAVLYAVPGLALTFAADEVLGALGAAPTALAVWGGGLLGGALLALALFNGLRRHTPVGGVLGRPVLLTNLLFGAVGLGASVTAARSGQVGPAAVAAAAAFGAVVVAYGLRLVARPAPDATARP